MSVKFSHDPLIVAGELHVYTDENGKKQVYDCANPPKGASDMVLGHYLEYAPAMGYILLLERKLAKANNCIDQIDSWLVNSGMETYLIDNFRTEYEAMK